MPQPDRTAELRELLDRAHRAVDRHPRHHFRVGELPPIAAHLPDAFVGLFPAAFEEVHQLELHGPRVLIEGHA